MVVEGAQPDVGRLGDLLDRGVVATLGEELLGSGDQGCASALFAPGSTIGGATLLNRAGLHGTTLPHGYLTDEAIITEDIVS